jgi:hypothetical protein
MRLLFTSLLPLTFDIKMFVPSLLFKSALYPGLQVTYCTGNNAMLLIDLIQ